MTAVPTAPSNGIDIAYETFGDPADPTILLIMGLGAQRVMWDDGVCALLVARGLHVVRFDNRDVGQSTWIDAPGLDVGAAVMEVLSGGDTSKVPYLLSEMAADAVGLLDHLGIASAHLMGASMGGMIAQTIAIEHPSRVLTLTSIMSTTGEPGYGEASPELAGVLLAPRPTDREGIIESGMAIQRAIASEHFDEARTRAVMELSYEQGFNPEGVGHQLLAILASGSRAEGLARLDLPALVIHGRQDRLVGFSGGQRTAELIAGADFLAIDDMAHDMPQVHWTRCADAVSALINRAV